jgi:hypothetical protein
VVSVGAALGMMAKSLAGIALKGQAYPAIPDIILAET